MRRRLSTIVVPLVLICFGVIASAAAQTAQIVSTYTSTAPKDCRALAVGATAKAV